MTQTKEYYESALAGKPLPISADHPQPGFYRMRVGKGSPYQSVAIFYRDGELMFALDGQTHYKDAVGRLKKHEAVDYWTWCADKPVTKEDYQHYRNNGSWPGDVNVPAGIGDNSGDLSLMEEVQDYIATAREWGETPRVDGIDKEAADKAANYASHLGTLASNLDKERKEKVAPHLEAQRAVNSEYNPVIEEAKALVKRLKQITGVFLRAEDERRRAALKALEAETSEPIEIPTVKAGGQRGRRVGLRTVIKYEVEIEQLVLEWALNNDSARAALTRAAIEIAEAAMKRGEEVQGMKRVETKEAV